MVSPVTASPARSAQFDPAARPEGTYHPPSEEKPFSEADQVLPGLVLDQPWKQAVFDFTREKLAHTAWGLAHSERDYLLATDIAAREQLPVDDDVLFAASFLHDMGAFPQYARPDMDHAVRSAEIVADEVLRPAGFPSQKIQAVQDAIVHHSYYDPVRPLTNEGVLLRDADCLDFLGAIGVARVLSLAGQGPGAPDLGTACRGVEGVLHDAPLGLSTLPASVSIGQSRAAETRMFLDALKAESVQGSAI